MPERFPGCITRVRGISAGHFTDTRRPTGCSVVIARPGAVGGVDVRGAAPGTRETDLLAPANTVSVVHAVLLSGGSAWGLDAAGGVMRWLHGQGLGLDGYAACQASLERGALAEGNVGAGAGATVGKMFGMGCAMKGGIGAASVTLDGVTVGALVAVNALGDVRDAQGRLLAGARTADGAALRDTTRALLAGEPPAALLAGRNTTIGVIATDANGKTYQAATPEQLSQQLLGYQIPIQYLHTWATGGYLPNHPHSTEADGSLNQLGWNISRTTHADGTPYILQLKNNQLTIRMVISEIAPISDTPAYCTARQI